MKQSYKLDFLSAGAIAKEVRVFGKSLIQTGASYNAITSQIIKMIYEKGARPAFPPQLALNEVAAHYLPSPDQDIILKNELVKLDIGVCYNGAIGDCAVTVDLSGNHQKLIDAAEAALLNAEKSIKIGLPVREIGAIIESTIQSYGLKPVKNLAGHGLGYYIIHMPPMIPNYNDRSKDIIKPGMTFAIEPFATDGYGAIHESGEAEIFSYNSGRPVRSENGRKLVAKIKTFDGLPFSTHDLLDAGFTLPELRQIIAELKSIGVIDGYGPLVERARGYVAQAENSILVDEKGAVFVTTR